MAGYILLLLFHTFMAWKGKTLCFIKINLWKRVISFESRCNFGEIDCEADCLNSGSSAMATIGLNDAEPQDFATAVRKHCTKFSTIVCSFSAKK